MSDYLKKLEKYLFDKNFIKEAHSVSLIIKESGGSKDCQKLYNEIIKLRSKRREVEDKLSGISNDRRRAKLTGDPDNPKRGTFNYITRKINSLTEQYSRECSNHSNSDSSQSKQNSSSGCNSYISRINSMTNSHNSLVESYDQCIADARAELNGAQPYNDRTNPVAICQSIQDRIDGLGDALDALTQEAEENNCNIRWTKPD